MEAEEFRDAQEAIGWDNRDCTFYFHVCEQTICNWRSGRQKIPGHVQGMLKTALENPKDLIEKRESGTVFSPN